MQGQVFKIHSDFYYVNTDVGVFECKLRDVLKKQKQSILVGDFVFLEQENSASMQAVISRILPRKNFISKPKAANISQAIIVSALKEPDIDFEQLNRYLAFCEYHNVSPILCFNKSDLLDDESLADKIKSIYDPLGYRLLFTSALEKSGLRHLSEVLDGNVTIFCGSSGVGKSSIINSLLGSEKIKTKNVSCRTQRGVHTTRHCEIIKVAQASSVVDTPGFSNLKFNFLMPAEIQKFFKEIKQLSSECKFANCTHQSEIGCNVLKNIDSIAKSRYDSYLKFLEEAKEYKEKITYNGQKSESVTKLNQNKVMTKISSKKRNLARKTFNQSINVDINEAENEY